MAVVNNILNKVSLNTAKYNENLQKMRKKTKAETKEMGSAFKAMGSAWAAVAGAISAGALGNAIVKELKATETAVAGFISTAGGVEQARATFEMLQQAARDTLQPFDALRAAAQDLQRNGIAPSAEQLKTFSQIAVSSGKSLETVTASFTAALQGRFKALNQLGITAQDMGTKLALTYKGTTTEIEKNSAALAGYFKEIGEQNKGALDYLQSGMTGAFNHLDNAWGDFVRSLAESGIGKLITDAVREIAGGLDSVTSWINENSPYIKQFFQSIGDAFGTIAKVVKDSTESALKFIAKFWDDSESESKDGISNIGFFLSQFFNFARVGFLEDVAKPAAKAWGAISGGLTAIGEGLGSSLSGGNFFDAYNNSLNRNANEIIQTQKELNAAIKFQLQDIDNARKNLVEELNKPLPTPKLPEAVSFQIGGAGGKSGGSKAAADTWGAYYAKMLELQSNAMSEREKIDAEYFSKLAELQEQAGKSQTATAEEINTVRELLETEHAQKIKELREQALAFYTESVGNEEQQIRESYSRKMEDLEAYHADQLLSESEFLEARNALYEQYNAEVTEFKKRQKDGGSYFFSKEEQQQVAEFSDGMNSLSDAFQNLTNSMSQSGAKYKALFAIQKAFAVASATANAIVAWSQALSDPTQVSWVAKLAQYANAIAMTTNILTQLKGVEMHDRGGRIGAGKIGIVGEFGPELVTGPANVTSRKDTADLARSALNGNGVQVNLYEDASRAGTVDTSQGMDGEQVINIFVSNIRRGGRMAQAMESTYQLHRYGGA